MIEAEARPGLSGEWSVVSDLLQKATEKHFQIMEQFYIFNLVTVTQLYEFLKTCRTTHLKCKFYHKRSHIQKQTYNMMSSI